MSLTSLVTIFPQVMAEAGVKRLVFSSSATVYGQPVYLPIDEEHPTGDCTNPYGKSKFFMEEIFKVSTQRLRRHLLGS